MLAATLRVANAKDTTGAYIDAAPAFPLQEDEPEHVPEPGKVLSREGHRV